MNRWTTFIRNTDTIKVVSVTLEGIEGLAKIKSTMDRLRENPPEIVAGKKVVAVRDISQLRDLIN